MADGDLAAMARTFDMPALLAKDASGFQAARSKLAAIDRRLVLLDRKVAPRDPLAVLYGARGGALLATVLLALSAAMQVL
ncbi:MAG: hypothetical protein D6782_04725 [Alphaproteobacteria bacterium]|nr:MAG: hypothetical protein D6782_04725 [Alphaproteobacteria bacterium]